MTERTVTKREQAMLDLCASRLDKNISPAQFVNTIEEFEEAVREEERTGKTQPAEG